MSINGICNMYVYLMCNDIFDYTELHIKVKYKVIVYVICNDIFIYTIT